MSILQVLRERADWLIVGFVGGAILLFVVDFEGCTGSRHQRQMMEHNEIAVIGGESISIIEFDERVRNLTEIYRLSGTSVISEELNENIREQIWEQIVRERVLGAEFDKLGLEVSDEELHSMVFGIEKHPIINQLFANPETGEVDVNYMNMFLSEMEHDPMVRSYWLFFEKEMITDRLNTKYDNLVSKGIYVTSFQTDFERSLPAREVDFIYTGQMLRTVPGDDIEISRSQIRSYYNANRRSFEREAKRSFEFVTFDIYPTEDDFNLVQGDMEQLRDEFAETSDPVNFINLTSDTRHQGFFRTPDELPEAVRDFAATGSSGDIHGPWLEDETYYLAKILDVQQRPDSVRARHILISPNQQRSLDMARAKADSLYEEITGGEDFEMVAMIHSDDPGGQRTGGDLGWFREGMMVLPFSNASFENRTGDIVITESEFGVHIIEILNQSPRVSKYNIGLIERAVEPSSTTIQDLRSKATRFANTNNTYTKFVEATNEQGLERRIATDVTPGQREVTGIINPRQVVRSLFETRRGEIMLDSYQQPVFELEEQFVVAFCTRIQEEGIPSLSEVEDEIREILIDKAKAEKLAEGFREKIAAGTDVRSIASDMGLTAETATGINFRAFTVPGMAGVEPSLVGAAVAAPVGETSGPVKGENGVFVLEVLSEEEREADDYDTTRQRIKMMLEMRSFYELFEALKEQVGVEDRRYRLF